MQHLDEGTIHSWLDGALTPDEAARAEAHVKDCPQCQAAVAEARGFIAASSRILTALDNAPRGVIPAAAPIRRVQPWVWRVAATVLVVATGTFLVLNQRGGKSYQASAPQVGLSQAVADSAATMQVTTEKAASSPSIVTQQAATGVVSGVVSAAPASAPPPAASLAKKQPAPTGNAAEGNLGARADQRLSEDRQASRAFARPEATAPVSGIAPMMRAPSVAAMDVASTVTPREVETKRMAGRTQTFYEVASGDTVILEEQVATELQGAVAGAGRATVDRRAQPMANRAAGKAAAVAETQQKTEAAAAPAPPPPVTALGDADEIHRISWLDRSSGRVLILSGRHSQEELEEIRRRIQQLRDAAARSKKLPD
ncbi:MAG TPA: zf-HC2 domain-containing protein [Gemmatimonadaceae bacterium]